MALKNPYQSKEHRVFKRSFLQQTEVNIKFTPAIAPSVFKERIVPFAKSYFDFDMRPNSDEDAVYARIEAKGEQKAYFFGPDFARIIVGPESYDTFAETILPMLPRLQAFLKEVADIDTSIELNITKRNAWPIGAKNAYESFTDSIGFVFNDKYVEDMRSYKFTDNPQPVQLSKLSTEELGDGIKVDRNILAAVQNSVYVILELMLSATAKGIPVADISADSVILNDVIYNNFIEYISDDIIDLMSNE